MDKLTSNDLAENRVLDYEAMTAVSGGSYSYPARSFNLVMKRGTSSGPRPVEDQILWPDNPYDIIDMI